MPDINKPTFMDIFDYIQAAQRDYFGFSPLLIKIRGNDYSLHIYEGRRQININRVGRDGRSMSIYNLIFDDRDGVKGYTVTKGICDYNHPDFRMKLSDPIHEIEEYSYATIFHQVLKKG